MAKLERVVKIYRSLAQIPAVAGAEIQSSNLINTSWSQRNLEKSAITKFSRTLVLNNLQCTESTPPVDITTETLSKVSNSQNLKAVLRDDNSKQFLEIWKLNKLIRVVDLAAADIHGNVFADIEFSSFEFSPDEGKVLYVAEKKLRKSEPFYKRKKPEEPQSDGYSGNTASKGQEFLYEQDWGEQLAGKKRSVLVEYDIESDSLKILNGVPDNICVAQPKYSPDGSYIIGVAYSTIPRKLGLIYCSNRPSTLFQLDFEGKYLELDLENTAVKSPIFTPNGNQVVWLERATGGPHLTCMRLVKTNVPLTRDSKTEVIVDIVQSERKLSPSNKTFYGIYNTGFPKRPWANHNQLFINTNQKYTINSYLINIDSGDIEELECDSGSQLILDVKDDLVVAVRRNFFVPDYLVVGKLPKAGSITSIEWIEITEKINVPEVQSATFKYFDLVAPGGDETAEFNAIYLGPASGEPNQVPLVLWPHGGPHVAFANYFFLEEALFLALGYAIVCVNYRGSIGFGENSVNYLLGKVGTVDVQDCIQAVDHTLKECPWINPDQLALCGGSHGGFIVTHISGQYPDKFKCCVTRNPVIDIASMSVSSDIPDWCYIEAGYSYTQKDEIDNHILLKMRELSPIVHAHKVKVPTLLQIGSKDLRVPSHQGVEYYCRLKANGVKVKMNLYDDNHSLGSVPNEMDNVINTVLWIEDALKGESSIHNIK
ncbi:hypothetical protein ABEB36_003373 [Hypothenemus hampei]|uniref:acylaminoacyl-peptidase n=1 Tax=Hypothenemus hampei TaxID=57062 RepID=A0ABD1F8X5_HYPHA